MGFVAVSSKRFHPSGTVQIQNTSSLSGVTAERSRRNIVHQGISAEVQSAIGSSVIRLRVVYMPRRDVSLQHSHPHEVVVIGDALRLRLAQRADGIALYFVS